MNPSSDTATHMELYDGSEEIGGVIHTHFPHATARAQTGRAPSCCGATHANYFYGEIPYARNLTAEGIEEGYEENTGKVIIETPQGKDPVYTPAVLCKSHGPFTWDRSVAEVVHNAVVLGEIARTNFMTEFINPQAGPAPQCMRNKHFMRKHGPNAYYGQGK